EKGADINAKDKSGWTAIMWASKNGHTEIVEYLKGKGADPSITTDILSNIAEEKTIEEQKEVKENKFIPQTISIFCHCGTPLEIIKLNPTAVSPQLCPSCGCMYALDTKDSPLRLQIGHFPACERPTNNDHKNVQENYYHDLLVRGEMAFLQKNYEDAGALFQKAIQLRPDEAQGYISACRALVYLCKDFDDIRYVLEGLDIAEDLISKGISKERMNKFDGKDEIALIRGMCYQLMSQYEEAAKHYYKVLEIDPDNEIARRLLNQLIK
ncbi:MAG: ankyrin repeat domain-containing protein, partial [Thermodesulfovibrionales bacterium]